MRFEHMTFCTQNRRATKLRYIPYQTTQEERDLNPQPSALETTALPIELSS